MTSGKSVSMSDAAIAWVEAMRAETRATFSKTLNIIILEHRGLSPAIKKERSLTQLRAAATALALDHDITEEAILAWVKQAVSGK